jgi:hypothetical protein
LKGKPSDQYYRNTDRDGRPRRGRKGETLRDGEKFSLPVQLLDAQLHDSQVAKYGGGAIRGVDAVGAPAGHRPGFLFDHYSTLADVAA